MLRKKGLKCFVCLPQDFLIEGDGVSFGLDMIWKGPRDVMMNRDRFQPFS